MAPEPSAPSNTAAAGSDNTAKQSWADAPGSAPPTAAASRSDRGPAPAPKQDEQVTLTDGKPRAGTRSANFATDGHWATIMQRMQKLGIGKYWVEGDPSGSVIFRCVIPLAGRRAVSQQFEGEGADLFTAAESALRRVALWKATEAP
jgi:hypothetical protein